MTHVTESWGKFNCRLLPTGFWPCGNCFFFLNGSLLSTFYCVPSLWQVHVMHSLIFSFTAPVVFYIAVELHISAAIVPPNITVVLREIMKNVISPQIEFLTVKDLNFTTCKDLILFMWFLRYFYIVLYEWALFCHSFNCLEKGVWWLS